ncbi:MAG: hypothetical protein SangKO_046750 [Sandaracinaceae bacterium]
MTLVRPTYWDGMPFDFRAPPERARVAPVKLRTQDLREVRGLRWSPPDGGRAGVLFMHPRVDFTRHYAIPRLVDAGFDVLALNSRSPNDDTDTVHEELVLDVAAGVDALRADHAKVALFGNSGGGSLMALHQREASRPPAERLARYAWGAPTALPRVTLQPADALVLVAAHRGEGHVLLRSIDPSVVDETDPVATDPALDMYAPENGFRPPPEEARYDAGFVRRYREAQRARVARLDAWALARLAEANDARRATKAPGFASLSPLQRQTIERARHTRHVKVVYRTMANLDYTDLSLDPSPRGYGSLLSERPDLMNRGLPGFARTVTPRAWLSTWSGLSSRADLALTLPEIDVPIFVAHAERDTEIFPRSDRAVIDAAIASEDRTTLVIEGARHYFEPEPGAERAPHVEALMDAIVPWLEARVG